MEKPPQHISMAAMPLLALKWIAHHDTVNNMNLYNNNNNGRSRPDGRSAWAPVWSPQRGRGVTAHERPVVKAVLQQDPEAGVLEKNTHFYPKSLSVLFFDTSAMSR